MHWRQALKRIRDLARGRPDEAEILAAVRRAETRHEFREIFDILDRLRGPTGPTGPGGPPAPSAR